MIENHFEALSLSPGPRLDLHKIFHIGACADIEFPHKLHNPASFHTYVLNKQKFTGDKDKENESERLFFTVAERGTRLILGSSS